MLMSTLVALLHMSTECGAATLDDVSKRFTLFAREGLSLACQEAWTKRIEDIGQFQIGPGHDVAVASTEEPVKSKSRGLVVERRARVETCR